MPARWPPLGLGLASTSDPAASGSVPASTAPGAFSGASNPAPALAPEPTGGLKADDAADAGGVRDLAPVPHSKLRSRFRLSVASCRENTTQKYMRITCSTAPESSTLHPL